MENNTKEKSGKLLIIFGILFTVILLADLFFMTTGVPMNGDISAQFETILKNISAYKTAYFFAALIGPFNVVLMILITFFVQTEKATPKFNSVSTFFLIPYLILVSIAYISQFTYFTDTLLINLKLARNWYFGNFHSLVKLIHQLGYTFFALSSLLMSYRFSMAKGFYKFFGIYMQIRSFFYIIAFAGLIAGNQLINSFTIGGLFLTLFFGIIAIILGKKSLI